jgi:hypothetical protein
MKIAETWVRFFPPSATRQAQSDAFEREGVLGTRAFRNQVSVALGVCALGLAYCILGLISDSPSKDPNGFTLYLVLTVLLAVLSSGGIRNAIRQRQAARAGAAKGGSKNDVIYDTEGWSPAQRDDLRSHLSEAGIPYVWESTSLKVDGVFERFVDLTVEDMNGSAD